MKKNQHKNAWLDYLKTSSVTEKAIAIMLTFVMTLIACVFIKEAFPYILVGALLLWLFSNHSTAQSEQQEVNQQERMNWAMELYRQAARCILPILKEYNSVLGIAPTTVNSIYSEEKCLSKPGLCEPVLVYTLERKTVSTIDLFDIKTAIQKRFNQEELGLYLREIDQRDAKFLKFYILPILSENARNWANVDIQNQFTNTKPQKPGDRRDKDF
ncbi:hypothetical protein [Lacrimispora celerecrescens]|jgi:hypothetical protein|uniref:Uncharacterized protein n=1 Tax=Lacrimispora celerecrescens TaxID=29354 RepID=A0A084JQD5_9FIRM|nr:hypothetical protein [Lacrimispora celerecrescens]KEZ91169.1 hypothetical protein IO98_05350 [Lacrimispora celerecrescens]